MRNFIISLACTAMAVWMLGSCVSKEEMAARRIELAKKVDTALQERNFKIDVLMMYPPRGGARNVAYGYSLEVRNDSLISYLPYFGRAYDVPYGGGKGLNFTAPVGSYQESMGKNGMRIIEVGTQNEEDRYLYRIEVFDNGRSTIDVLSQNRETISFSGEMTFD